MADKKVLLTLNSVEPFLGADLTVIFVTFSKTPWSDLLSGCPCPASGLLNSGVDSAGRGQFLGEAQAGWFPPQGSWVSLEPGRPPSLHRAKCYHPPPPASPAKHPGSPPSELHPPPEAHAR